MSSRYRVEYALKSHRRDEFIEWIKGLLAVPFVLHAGPTIHEKKTGEIAQGRYAEVFRDVELLIKDKIFMDSQDLAQLARLNSLVPSVGTFFTRLPLERAFLIQDSKRAISARRLVAPSFNDIRLILNTAQALSLAENSKDDPSKRLKLVTFDGDVTLYDDGSSLRKDDPVVTRLIGLLSRNISVGIVTAAGYSDHSGAHYEIRLEGLLEAVRESKTLTVDQKNNIFVMGGESNYLFRFNEESGHLKWISPEQWALPEVKAWKNDDVVQLLDYAEKGLKDSQAHLRLLDTTLIIRKERGVGIVPKPGFKICREILEEIVLTAQNNLQALDITQHINFSAFNGGSDVWVDIGDKKLGVLSLQQYMGDVNGNQTLHVGDQFASVGANDFKARQAACTVWIASPTETVNIMDELMLYLDENQIM